MECNQVEIFRLHALLTWDTLLNRAEKRVNEIFCIRGDFIYFISDITNKHEIFCELNKTTFIKKIHEYESILNDWRK